MSVILAAYKVGGELFELEPVDPYTDEDLNYNDDNSRVSQEYADESLRNVELVADTVDDWKDVERVYIGYAVWWGIAAWSKKLSWRLIISQERPSFPSVHQQVLVWVTAVNCWQNWPEPVIGRKVCDSAPVFQMKMWYLGWRAWSKN